MKCTPVSSYFRIKEGHMLSLLYKRHYSQTIMAFLDALFTYFGGVGRGADMSVQAAKYQKLKTQKTEKT